MGEDSPAADTNPTRGLSVLSYRKSPPGNTQSTGFPQEVIPLIFSWCQTVMGQHAFGIGCQRNKASIGESLLTPDFCGLQVKNGEHINRDAERRHLTYTDPSR